MKHSWLKDNVVELLAVIWTLFGCFFLFEAASGGFKGTESIQTQIIQGIFGILILITGYYWGNSNGKKSSATNIQTQDNASVTISPNESSSVEPSIDKPCQDCP